MPRILVLLLALWALAVPAQAETIVSPRAASVSVTVYRAPFRAKGPIDRDWPGGYALVTESRTVDLPQGESVLRFEGVAEGLMPETAILSGMPRGVREKNRDARLLSPAGLVDAYLKRSVTLRRTDRKTGKVTQQDAIISAGPTGGVILKTAQGYEALGCSGLPERMLYPQKPADLSPRPTLSVTATSDRPTRATLQLTYLAEGFDWAANYVADMGDDGRTLDLMAWLTVANGGVTGFPDAQLSVIAGQPNKQARRAQPRPTGGPLRLTCWPTDVTSTHPKWILSPTEGPPPPLMYVAAEAEDIVVTSMRRTEGVVMAAPAPPPPPPPPPEDVGDLKLYRVPMAVDVAPNAQKQVALLRQPGVKVERLYAATVYGDAGSQSMTLRLRVQNRKDDGLGLPMPSGRVAVFEQVQDMRLLAGEADIGDKAEGERVDYDIASSADVRIAARVSAQSRKSRNWAITLTNARPFAVTAEVTIPHDIAPRPADMERRGNGWIWRTRIPANDKRTWSYTERLAR
ncbi:DUF4139 domain-containing protein [Sphingobium cupriresistens]|uniref:DUF4139 domain-containing protein n=1 Tax=Sphingobium cupriresistens TaxID=1132417 RepID=A0A8G2DY64_9SPHN|nr:hypothetical protein [Sphingobium cupriresistens]RYM14423.1 hypothetical protein EWH12_01310 [Sphingobium cupriresistens]